MFATTNVVKSICKVSFACANIERMGNALIAARLDAEIARLLSEQQKLSGISLRELSRLSEVKLTRLGDILKRGRAATAGEIERIAEALGLEGWKVLFAARSSPVEWCNRFVSFGVGYALSWSGGSSCWVGWGVSRDLVRMSRLR